MTQHYWEPTPQQIAREAARIRAGWSEQQRQNRWLSSHCLPGHVERLREELECPHIEARISISNDAGSGMRSL